MATVLVHLSEKGGGTPMMSVWQLAVKFELDKSWNRVMQFAQQNVDAWQLSIAKGRRGTFTACPIVVLHSRFRSRVARFVIRLNALLRLKGGGGKKDSANNGNSSTTTPSPLSSSSASIPLRPQLKESNLDVAYKEQREAILQSPKLRAIAESTWAAIPKDRRGHCTHASHFQLFDKFFDVFVFDNGTDGEVKRAFIDHDWTARSAGRPALDLDQFVESTLFMCDAWCETCDAAEFYEFLATVRLLTRNIFGSELSKNISSSYCQTSFQQNETQLPALTGMMGDGTHEEYVREAEVIIKSSLGRRNIDAAAIPAKYEATRSLACFVGALNRSNVPQFAVRGQKKSSGVVQRRHSEAEGLQLVDDGGSDDDSDVPSDLGAPLTPRGIAGGGNSEPDDLLMNSSLCGTPRSLTSSSVDGSPRNAASSLLCSCDEVDSVYFTSNGCMMRGIPQHARHLSELQAEKSSSAFFSTRLFRAGRALNSACIAFDVSILGTDAESAAEVPRCQGVNSINTPSLHRVSLYSMLPLTWYVKAENSFGSSSSWEPMPQRESEALTMGWLHGAAKCALRSAEMECTADYATLTARLQLKGSSDGGDVSVMRSPRSKGSSSPRYSSGPSFADAKQVALRARTDTLVQYKNDRDPLQWSSFPREVQQQLARHVSERLGSGPNSIDSQRDLQAALRSVPDITFEGNIANVMETVHRVSTANMTLFSQPADTFGRNFEVKKLPLRVLSFVIDSTGGEEPLILPFAEMNDRLRFGSTVGMEPPPAWAPENTQGGGGHKPLDRPSSELLLPQTESSALVPRQDESVDAKQVRKAVSPPADQDAPPPVRCTTPGANPMRFPVTVKQPYDFRGESKARQRIGRMRQEFDKVLHSPPQASYVDRSISGAQSAVAPRGRALSRSRFEALGGGQVSRVAPRFTSLLCDGPSSTPGGETDTGAASAFHMPPLVDDGNPPLGSTAMLRRAATPSPLRAQRLSQVPSRASTPSIIFGPGRLGTPSQQQQQQQAGRVGGSLPPRPCLSLFTAPQSTVQRPPTRSSLLPVSPVGAHTTDARRTITGSGPLAPQAVKRNLSTFLSHGAIDAPSANLKLIQVPLSADSFLFQTNL